MFESIKYFFTLFNQGKAVVNAAKMKNKQIIGNAVTALLGTVILIAKAFGHDIPLSNDDLVTIGGFIAVALCLFNGTATVITSEKVGLPAKPEPSKFPPITTDLPVVNPPAQRDSSGVSTSKYY